MIETVFIVVASDQNIMGGGVEAVYREKEDADKHLKAIAHEFGEAVENDCVSTLSNSWYVVEKSISLSFPPVTELDELEF